MSDDREHQDANDACGVYAPRLSSTKHHTVMTVMLGVEVARHVFADISARSFPNWRCEEARAIRAPLQRPDFAGKSTYRSNLLAGCRIPEFDLRVQGTFTELRGDQLRAIRAPRQRSDRPGLRNDSADFAAGAAFPNSDCSIVAS